MMGLWDRWTGLSERLRRAAGMLGWMKWLVLVGVVGGFLGVSWWMYRDVVSGRVVTVRVEPVFLDRRKAPSWLTEYDLRSMERLANKAAEGRNFFDEGLPEDVAAALSRSPWVMRVSFVRRRFPAHLDCEVVVRSPFAVVDVGKGIAVDDGGVRLPLEFARPEAAGFPVIKGVRSYPPEAGKEWRDAAVAAGLVFLRRLRPLLAGKDDPLEPRVVLVEFRGGLPVVSVKTACGPVVYWGVAYRPGEEPMGLPDIAERLKAIRRFLARTPPESVEVIDATTLPIAFKPAAGAR